MKHELKIWPEFYDAVAHDVKTFEIREDDRDIRVGDTLRLVEWNPEEFYTGRMVDVYVTYTLRDPRFVPKGKVLMSIKRVSL